MSKTLNTLLAQRGWISHIDDERSEGNSIIVTLKPDWFFVLENSGGVRGFDTVREVEEGTRKGAVYKTK
jgi:hypothetical protein